MTEKVTKKKTTRKRRSTKSDDKLDEVLDEVKETLDSDEVVDEAPVISEEKKELVEKGFKPVQVEVVTNEKKLGANITQNIKAELKDSLLSKVEETYSAVKSSKADDVPHKVEASNVEVEPNHKREGMSIGGMGKTTQPRKNRANKKPSRFTEPVYQDRDGVGSVQQTTFSQGK